MGNETSATSALLTQEGGDHYKKLGAYQPWEVLHKWLTPEELKGFAKGTVIAYLAREQNKGGRLDIQKAAHTLQIYLELSASDAEPSAQDTVQEAEELAAWAEQKEKTLHEKFISILGGQATKSGD